MKRASRNSFSIICTVSSRWLALQVRRNRRFGGLSLALLGIWDMALISCTAPSSGEAVDDTMTYRYREEKGFYRQRGY